MIVDRGCSRDKQNFFPEVSVADDLGNDVVVAGGGVIVDRGFYCVQARNTVCVSSASQRAN